jgi:ABC-type glycerol-3-phosphate transport system substrate-binding protein
MGRAKKWLTGLLALTFIASITACGGEDKNTASKGTQEKIKLRMTWWGSQARHDVTMKAIELYEEQNPNIQIESEYSGWDGYWDKLATLSAAKNMPDIIQMDAAYIGEYVNRNQLLDLSDMSMPQIDTTLMTAGKVNDKQYGIPAGKNAWGMVYNKELFAEYGIAEPKEGWTWDEYFATAREVQAKMPKDVHFSKDLTIGAHEDYTGYQLAQGKGSLYVDGKLNLDKETWLKWHSIWADFRKEGIVASPDQSIAEVAMDIQFDYLVKGTILIRPIHAAEAGAIDSLMPDKIGVTQFPIAEEAGSWLKPTFFWTVNADSKQAEESKKFIDWMLNDVEAGKVMKTERGTPVNDDVFNAIKGDLNSAALLGKEMIDKIAVDAQVFSPVPTGWSEFPKEYSTIGQTILFGKMTPEEAYDHLVKFADDLAKNANKK